MKALETSVLGNYILALSDVEGIAEKIKEKVQSIIYTIHRAFEVSGPTSWSYGKFDKLELPHFDDKDIEIDFEYINPLKIDLHTDEYNYHVQFPYNFLFKSCEEIKKIVIVQRQKKFRNEEAKNLEYAAERTRKNEKIKKALEKLTAEEKKVLGYV